MDWKTLLAYITGTVDQELLVRNAYLRNAPIKTRGTYSSSLSPAKTKRTQTLCGVVNASEGS